jgi:hypothetical protein
LIDISLFANQTLGIKEKVRVERGEKVVGINGMVDGVVEWPWKRMLTG